MFWLNLFVVLIVVFAAVALLFLLAIMPKMKKHEWTHEIKKYRYAHRGLFSRENKVPENSLLAFEKAIEKGFGFELDVHLTADGKLVVIHDSSLKRTAGVDIDVSKSTYEEISAYRLEGTDEKVPLFDEVLSLNGGKVPMIVELKADNNTKELVAEVVKALRAYSGIYCTESFAPDIVYALKKEAPEIMRGQLACDIRKGNKKFSVIGGFILKNLVTNFLTKPDFIAYAYNDRDSFSFSLCRKLFKPTEVSWTIKNAEAMKKAENAGACVIFDSFVP